MKQRGEGRGKPVLRKPVSEESARARVSTTVGGLRTDSSGGAPRKRSRDAGAPTARHEHRMSFDAALREAVRTVVREELDRAVAELVAELRADGTPRLLDRDGAARLLNVSTKTLDRLVKQGAPHLLVGDSKRFEPAVLVAWLRGRGAGRLRVVP